MKMGKLHDGKIKISRPNYGCGKEVICITVKDAEARVEFLEIEISYEDFTKALTGQANIPIQFEVRGLEFVGKKMESKKLEFVLEASTEGYARHYENKAIKQAPNHVDPGWTPSEYYRSKDSFYYSEEEKGMIARTTQYRYVEKNDDEK